MSTLYAGPGKIWMNGTALWPEGENGEIRASIEQEVVAVASGMYGRVTGVQGGVVGKITLTPFDNWGALGLLFPPWLGVSVGASVGTLAIGARPHGATDAACCIWTPDGRLYTFPRAAVTRHPDLHLGISSALFGPVEITALVGSAKKIGDAAALSTNRGVGHRGSRRTDGAEGLRARELDGGLGDGGRVWGRLGRGANRVGGGMAPSSEVKYSSLPVQRLARAYKLDSVKFMAKVRPYGPTHSQINAAIGVNNGRLLGSQIASATTAANLVLSGPNSKTITLKSADVVGAGFEFGGTKLGTGEIGFVTTMQFVSGVAQPLMVFSA